MHFQRKPVDMKLSFGNNPELLDTLWGIYFATSDYRPIWRILTMLPWSKDHDNADRLTVGSGAKYTLANNAARYPDVLALLKEMAPYQSPEVAKILERRHCVGRDVANRADPQGAAGRDRRAQAQGAGLPARRIEALGLGRPGRDRDRLHRAATASLTSLGLPCVIGGAVTSAAMNYWASQ